MKILNDIIANVNRRNFGPVQFFCVLFILCVFCVSATYFMRTDSHNVFQFYTGKTIREGAIGGGGCEPKDIIALGDALSTDPIISGLTQNKQISEVIKNSKSEKVKAVWNDFNKIAIMAKGAAMMRSKPDEQMIRKVMAEGAANKNIDCTKMSEDIKEIETTGLSAEQKNTIKKYTSEMVNMGQCLGWCK